MVKVPQQHEEATQPEVDDPLADYCYEDGIASPVYTWCLMCEQVYLTRDWRRRKRKSGGFYAIQQGRCPNCGEWEECDSLPWQQVRLERKEYPRVPTIGLRYPLHGWPEQTN